MNIWCVEDDESVREIEVYTLRSTGFEARGFANGADFQAALKEQLPDLVVLDVMLPGEDGVAVLKRLKSDPATREIPVIMATAKGMEYDKVQSLDLGADDYLVKPFGMMEMVSRIKAVLRRSAPAPDSLLRSDELELDTKRHMVRLCGEVIPLTYKEFEMLRLFLSHPDMVFTREKLTALVWGEDYLGESRTIDVHIRTLRKKLGEYGGRIQTVRGVGYRFGPVDPA